MLEPEAALGREPASESGPDKPALPFPTVGFWNTAAARERGALWPRRQLVAQNGLAWGARACAVKGVETDARSRAASTSRRASAPIAAFASEGVE